MSTWRRRGACGGPAPGAPASARGGRAPALCSPVPSAPSRCSARPSDARGWERSWRRKCSDRLYKCKSNKGEAMRAVVMHETGGPDVLREEDIDRPEPADGQVL